ncbi:hypothetical protein GCM10010862_38170 [Devosia nitrariae]|uniref:Uncharacterized protein n=1 Tax=Devosia nitrariae TaxID=2071872 RepID=A0ABQ5WA08_9HYPH|nr:hypothetical protein GCM10010862_38170 [Devosia nitrariae]
MVQGQSSQGEASYLYRLPGAEKWCSREFLYRRSGPARFGQKLMGFDKRGRTGKLTSFGQSAGAMAAHFWTYDYILRNAR